MHRTEGIDCGLIPVPGELFAPGFVICDMRRSETNLHTSNWGIGVAFHMTHDERRKMLESFGRAPALLAATLRQLPKKMWLYKPAPERWSIHEIILHLADSEASSYVRCRRLIAEPGVEVPEFDPARWAGNLGYFHQSTREALEIIRRLRKMTYQLLIAVPEPVWSHTTECPKEGAISLESWIERQERHIPHHMEQMRANYAIWIGSHPPRKPATRSTGPASHRPVSLSAEYC
jgi:DinB superfamily